MKKIRNLEFKFTFKYFRTFAHKLSTNSATHALTKGSMYWLKERCRIKKREKKTKQTTKWSSFSFFLDMFDIVGKLKYAIIPLGGEHSNHNEETWFDVKSMLGNKFCSDEEKCMHGIFENVNKREQINTYNG